MAGYKKRGGPQGNAPKPPEFPDATPPLTGPDREQIVRRIHTDPGAFIEGINLEAALSVPLEDEVVGDIGKSARYAREDHIHPANTTYIQSLIDAAISAARPVGEVAFFAQGSAPDGYLLADGSVVSRTTYADLFGEIGTDYNTGGEAGTTFRLPNVSGKVIVGKGSGTFATRGAAGGAETVTLDVTMIPAHDHSGVTGSANSGSTTPASVNSGGESAHTHAASFNSGAEAAHTHVQSGNTGTEAAHTHAISINSGTENAHTHAVSGNTGSTTPASVNSGSTTPATVNSGAEAAHSHAHNYNDAADNTHTGSGHAISGFNAAGTAAATAAGSSHTHTCPGSAHTHTVGGSAHTHTVSINSGVGTAHSHTVSGNSGAGDSHTHTISGNTGAGSSHTHTVAGNTGVGDSHTHTVAGSAHTHTIPALTISSQGGGLSHANLQPYIVLPAYICF